MVLAVHLLKTRRELKKFNETEDPNFVYQNELDKLVSNMIWLIEILKIYLEEQLLIKYHSNKAFNFAADLKYDKYERDLASIGFSNFW